jgi:hypothetical protein
MKRYIVLNFMSGGYCCRCFTSCDPVYRLIIADGDEIYNDIDVCQHCLFNIIQSKER